MLKQIKRKITFGIAAFLTGMMAMSVLYIIPAKAGGVSEESIEKITAEDGFFIEGTGGYDMDGYYYYDLWPVLTLHMGDGSLISGTPDKIEDASGLSVDIWDPQSKTNPWKAGTHALTVKVGNVSTVWTVYVKELSSFSVSPVSIKEEMQGNYYRNWWSGGCWYEYDVRAEHLNLTFKDGTTDSCSLAEFEKRYGTYVLFIETEQNAGDPWEVGGTYSASAIIGNVSSAMQVSVIPNGIRSVTADPVILYEHSGGFWMTEDDDYAWDEDEEDYYAYDVQPRYFTLMYDNGSTERVSYLELIEQYVFPYVVDPQCYDDPLTVGEHTFTVYLYGKEIRYSVTLKSSVSERLEEEEFNGGWHREEGKWYYSDENGVYRDQWLNLGGKTYYFDDAGIMAENGQFFIDGDYYYFLDSGALYKGWQRIGSSWYFFDSERVSSRWVSSQGKWYYMDYDGRMSTGWKWIETVGWDEEKDDPILHGNWYFFSISGVMTTGWKQLEGFWYYFEANGTMKTGWMQVGSDWYFLGMNGGMKTGWAKISGSWYFFDESGRMQKNWQEIEGRWYYLGSDGTMRTGWQKVDGEWYYLDSYMKTGWQKIGGEWYYLRNSMRTGWQKIDGSWYYLNSSMKTGWVHVSGSWYYLGNNGQMQSGWIYDSGWYYLDPANGSRMVCGTTMMIDGISYSFAANGAMIR